MLEKWKSGVDNKRNFGAILTDMSKAFGCLSNDLLFAKLNAYGFSLLALRRVQSYLSNRTQRSKINSEFSSWEEILFVVPQGSRTSLYLWYFIWSFLCDSFFIINVDWNILKLQNAAKTLLKWFNDNQMKANPDKCHFIYCSSVKTSIMIQNEQISNSPCKKMFGVFFDSKLTFQSHSQLL